MAAGAELTELVVAVSPVSGGKALPTNPSFVIGEKSTKHTCEQMTDAYF